MAQRRSTPLVVPTADPHVCTPGVRLRMLARVPLFADLDVHDIAQVDRHCQAHAFEAGAVVYHAGASATRMYVVATGAVKAVRPALDGRETILDLCAPGDFLGAVPALGEDVYSDTAWAVSASCLLGLEAHDFDAIMERFPAVARATLRGVSRRLSQAQQAVHLLAGEPLEQRLAAMLLLIADKMGRPWGGGILLDVPLTREDLASMTGAAPESVSRLLSGWRRAGLIDSGRRWIAVRDLKALHALRDA